MSTDVLLQAENLSRRYGERQAVDGVNLTLRPGDVLGFLGPNGAGKSSTMAMLAGVLAPSAGRIRIAGADLLDEPAAAKRNIGYLPEQPPVYRELTVDEYLGFCARLRGLRGAPAARAVEQAKQRCGLEQAGGRLIGNLSKGYQQRAGIAQAILHTPQVVILDEPTVGLDPIQIREIRSLIADLGREHAVLLSTHILPEVQAVCSRVEIIHQGRQVFSGSVADLAGSLDGTRLLLMLEQPPPSPEALAHLPGVAAVEELGGGRYRLCPTSPGSAADVLAACVAQGWRPAELAPERKTLEQLFIDLTCQDSAPAAPSSASQGAAT
jgi:ABC-2 type transport system ATP-binding protein